MEKENYPQPPPDRRLIKKPSQPILSQFKDDDYNNESINQIKLKHIEDLRNKIQTYQLLEM